MQNQTPVIFVSNRLVSPLIFGQSLYDFASDGPYTDFCAGMLNVMSFKLILHDSKIDYQLEFNTKYLKILSTRTCVFSRVNVVQKLDNLYLKSHDSRVGEIIKPDVICNLHNLVHFKAKSFALT